MRPDHFGKILSLTITKMGPSMNYTFQFVSSLFLCHTFKPTFNTKAKYKGMLNLFFKKIEKPRLRAGIKLKRVFVVKGLNQMVGWPL
jgi:hypothetical protein